MRTSMNLALTTLLWQPQRQEQPATGYTAIYLVRVQASMIVAQTISLDSYVRSDRRG